LRINEKDEVLDFSREIGGPWTQWTEYTVDSAAVARLFRVFVDVDVTAIDELLERMASPRLSGRVRF
jgi:hypothetical protein